MPSSYGNCKFKKNRAQELGVSFVEIALTLPLFIIGIFAFIWLAQYWNAKSSLSYAVGNALKLAQTRGNPLIENSSMPGYGLIPQVDDFLAGNQNALDEFLASPDLRASGYIDYYNEVTIGEFCVVDLVRGKCDLSTIPTEYIYALIYVNESMRQNIGSGLRYPCDPTEDDLSKGGPGCLSCKFESPKAYLGVSAASGATASIIDLTCTYQPNLAVLSSVVGMLKVLTGNIAMPKLLLTSSKSTESS